MRYAFNQIDSTTYEVVWAQSNNTRTITLTSPTDDNIINDLQNPENLSKFVGILIDNTINDSNNNSSSYTIAKNLYNSNRTKYDKLKVESQTSAFNSASFSNGTLTLTSIGGDNTTINGMGGGGVPGGNNREIQYNDNGTFAGAVNVGISSEGNLNLTATTDPATPSAGTLTMYSKTIAGRTLPKIKGPSGLDYVLQSALYQNAVYIWNQTNASAGSWIGTVGIGTGTFTNTLPSTGGGGNTYSIQKRAKYANVVTTLNQPIGQRNSENIFFRGSVAGQGGFFFYTRCGFDVWSNGCRFFAGMATSNAVITADPSSLNNTVGFCVDSGDLGSISFLTRGTTATKQSTGLTITSGKGYDIFIFNQPNSSTFHYRIVDLITGTEYSNSSTLTPPNAGVGLSANVLASNASLTAANSIQLGISKIYIETDY